MILPASSLAITAYHLAAFDQADRWLSKTSIRDFAEHGPAHWNLTYNTREIERTKPGGVEQGLALDCWLTEGQDVFQGRYVIKPDGPEGDGRTTAGKAWKAAHADKLILSQDDNLILQDAVFAVQSLPCYGEISNSLAQATIRRKAGGAMFGLQSRPDWLSQDGTILYDLKKTRDLDRFGAQAIDIGYHTQAALAGYCLGGEGIALEIAYLVAVEWERGARARVFEIPEDVMLHAWNELQETCGEIARRMEEGDWTDIQAKPEPLEIPGWMRRKMEEG